MSMHLLIRILACAGSWLGAATASAAEPTTADQPPRTQAASSTAGTDAAPAKAAARGRAAPVDPMQALREKLALRLGAIRAPGAPSDQVMRISTHVDAAAPASAGEALTTGRRAAALSPARKAGEARAGHWSYTGESGPEAWGRLKPEFARCASGSRQSPIDIRDGIRVDLDPVQFDYRPSAFRVLDNGHTVQVNVAAGNSIEVMGRRYELQQFHFHRPSEERIDGRQFDMVAHLVHKDLDGRLAVVAVLIERGGAHPVVQAVWNNLPLEKGDEVAARAPLDLNHLLPQDRRYYTYMGSLTTPPCSEGVLWMVLQQPVGLSSEQIDVFARLYPMNARPIQHAAGRLIKQSN